MLRAEIAIAADGSIVDMDLIWGSLGGDLNDVYRHIEQIERGDMSGLNRMDAKQREAVLRVRQKLEAIKKISFLVDAHKIEAIAIGNGTASRETAEFASNLIKDNIKINLTKKGTITGIKRRKAIK